ncbi:MAG TPA: PQQ-dependent sugar dehydrogenase, partial [Propionibacteriaceae bacterium]|nr:PQQ-dependent sugar dehydrogenase [Propionibacteriaceae bacterium]
MTRAITFRLLAGAVCGAFLLAGCSDPQSVPSTDTRTAGPASPSAAPTTPTTSPTGATTPTRRGRPVATEALRGLTSPWGLVALRNGNLLISERDTKQILLVNGDAKESLRTIEEVEPGGEGGLLGLAVTPDERQVFAYYSAADDNRIVAMSFDGRTLGEPQVILDGIPRAQIHNGGRLLIGPDGFLYVATGDAADSQLAQDRESLAGKILRISLDGEPAPGNPFGNEVFSLGHRNVQGLAFDEEDRLWACEFGSQEWDELNLISEGNNYGWPLVEGSGEGDGLTNPKVVWETSEASPSGLAYWQGELWMAGLRGERLWEIPVDGTETGEPIAHFEGEYGRLRTVVVSNDGQSLLLTGSNTDGRGDV